MLNTINKGGEANRLKWLNIRMEYEKNPNLCESCNNPIDWHQKNNRFCSNSCSATFNNLKRHSCINRYGTKIVICPKCKNNRIVNIRQSIINFKCSECRNAELVDPAKCKQCGQYVCLFREKCDSQFVKSLLRFGFNPNFLGNIEFYQEYDRIGQILKDLYEVECWPGSLIAEMYGFNKSGSFMKILRKFDIRIRNISESNKLALVFGRAELNTMKTRYKQGWHTSWTGNEIFYRSSYELDYALELDKKKINYEVESLRIEYWDSQKHSYRIAIPDFYLKDFNEIVEIKSNYTYNEQNMNDRVQRFKELGYNFKLFLDKKEIKWRQ